MRFRLAALLVITWSTLAGAESPGVEAACTALGANCKCSEPLDTNNFGSNPATTWNPADSTTRQCWGNLQAIASTGAQSSPDLHYGGTTPPTYAWYQMRSYVDMPSFNAKAGDRRMCIRWYHRFGNQTQPPADACANTYGKILDFKDDARQWWHNSVDDLGRCPNLDEWRGSSIEGGNSDSSNFGLQPSTWTMKKCVADSTGKRGWCRFEFCAGGVLDGAGSRYVEAKITALDDGTSASVRATNYAGVNPFEMHYNSAPGGTGEIARRETAYYMEASWPSDSSQWIGAASEIEGNVPTPAKLSKPGIPRIVR